MKIGNKSYKIFPIKIAEFKSDTEAQFIILPAIQYLIERFHLPINSGKSPIFREMKQ